MTAARSTFAHASEAELARILDFYDVAWRYEPHSFPILFDRAGNVLESFTPDFYLPDLDLYVELTTLKQRLVRKKNRKLRRLRELYPAIRVKLLYARDFRALMLKYGRLALADAFSGADGQTTPGRGAVARAPRVRAGAGSRPAVAGVSRATRSDDRPEAPARAARTAGPSPAEAAAPSQPSERPRRARRTRSEARARAAARAAGAGSTPPEVTA